jgi:hypothetical protein
VRLFVFRRCVFFVEGDSRPAALGKAQQQKLQNSYQFRSYYPIRHLG